VTHAIVVEESSLLERVLRGLATLPVDTPPSEAETVAELVRIRDEVQAAKEEDKASLLQQFEHHHALLAQLRATRERPSVDPGTPYFAHMRIREDGKERDVCLGKATRIDGGLRIIDWRNAPISKIFYTYRQGDDFEEEVGDRWMEGTITARRTVTIRAGQLERIDAPEGIFVPDGAGGWTHRGRDAHRLTGGQGTSFTVLHDAGGGTDRRLGTDGQGATSRVDKRLPDIASLIDPEQFALITRPNAGFVVIRGTAGSGKTTVALHRIAYLAYNDPKVDGPDTLFVVFSRALRDYVGRVLPALGVHRVEAVSFPEWVRETRRRHFPKLPKSVRDDTPEIVVRLKTHPVMLLALEAHIASHRGPSTVETALDDWASVTTQLDAIAPFVAQHARHAFSDDELLRATTWCRDRYDELMRWLEREPGVEGAIDAEDEPLLLRAYQLRVGPLRRKDDPSRPMRHRHVAVDEVQDFTPLEVRLLLDTLDEKKSITLAGDTQQHVMKDAGFTDWAGFFGWLGVPGTAVDTLKVAYRSSRPIVAFAAGLLGPLREDADAPVTVRDGPPVELFRFTDHGAVVVFLADVLQELLRDEPFANVAIVTPNVGLAETYERGLRAAEVPRVRRVTDEDFSFAPGVEVVDVQQVKGLEFDYVVLVEPSAGLFPETPSARRLLHVAATRAIHQLWVTCVGAPSPIVEAALAER
jgi:DNA helicase-2/ATP-dependent DNA helicase PcrA